MPMQPLQLHGTDSSDDDASVSPAPMSMSGGSDDDDTSGHAMSEDNLTITDQSMSNEASDSDDDDVSQPGSPEASPEALATEESDGPLSYSYSLSSAESTDDDEDITYTPPYAKIYRARALDHVYRGGRYFYAESTTLTNSPGAQVINMLTRMLYYQLTQERVADSAPSIQLRHLGWDLDAVTMQMQRLRYVCKWTHAFQVYYKIKGSGSFTVRVFHGGGAPSALSMETVKQIGDRNALFKSSQLLPPPFDNQALRDACIYGDPEPQGRFDADGNLISHNYRQCDFDNPFWLATAPGATCQITKVRCYASGVYQLVPSHQAEQVLPQPPSASTAMFCLLTKLAVYQLTWAGSIRDEFANPFDIWDEEVPSDFASITDVTRLLARLRCVCRYAFRFQLYYCDKHSPHTRPVLLYKLAQLRPGPFTEWHSTRRGQATLANTR